MDKNIVEANQKYFEEILYKNNMQPCEITETACRILAERFEDKVLVDRMRLGELESCQAKKELEKADNLNISSTDYINVIHDQKEIVEKNNNIARSEINELKNVVVSQAIRIAKLLEVK